jgi:hypothetical protein
MGRNSSFFMSRCGRSSLNGLRAGHIGRTASHRLRPPLGVVEFEGIVSKLASNFEAEAGAVLVIARVQ